MNSPSPLRPNSTACEAPSAKVEFTTFRHRADNHPVRDAQPWRELAMRLTTHVERPVKDGEMFSPATFRRSKTRSNGSVETINFLVHDLDHEFDLDTICARLQPYAHVVYSTHSHTPLSPRLRVAVRLTRPISVEEHADLWRRAQVHLYDGAADEAAKAASQAFYLPSCPPGAPTIAITHEGRALDPGELPAVARAKQRRTELVPEVIHDGERNRTLVSLAGTLRSRGITTPSVLAALRAVNGTQCDPPLADERVLQIAESSASWWEPPTDHCGGGGSCPGCCPCCQRAENDEVHALSAQAAKNHGLRGAAPVALAVVAEARRAQESESAGSDGYFRLPLARLAVDAAACHKTVARHLARLEAGGLVVTAQRHEEGQPPGHTTTYLRLMTQPLELLRALTTVTLPATDSLPRYRRVTCCANPDVWAERRVVCRNCGMVLTESSHPAPVGTLFPQGDEIDAADDHVLLPPQPGYVLGGKPCPDDELDNKMDGECGNGFLTPACELRGAVVRGP